MIISLVGLSLALGPAQGARPSSSVLYRSCSRVVEYEASGTEYRDDGACHLAVSSTFPHGKSPGQPVPPEEVGSSYCPPPWNGLSVENSLPAALVFVHYARANNLTDVVNDNGEAAMLAALVRRWPCAPSAR